MKKKNIKYISNPLEVLKLNHKENIREGIIEKVSIDPYTFDPYYMVKNENGDYEFVMKCSDEIKSKGTKEILMKRFNDKKENHKLYWLIKNSETNEILGETDRFESLENEPEKVKQQRYSYRKNTPKITFEIKIEKNEP